MLESCWTGAKGKILIHILHPHTTPTYFIICTLVMSYPVMSYSLSCNHGRKSHGELICRFLHVIDERNRRIKEQSRDSHLNFFFAGRKGWGMGSRIDGSKGCLSGYIWWGGLFETLLDGVLKPCNSHLGGPSKSERHSCRWFGRAESSSRAGVFFLFLSQFFFFFFFFARHSQRERESGPPHKERSRGGGGGG